MDPFTLFMTLPNTILPLTDVGHDFKCLVYLQRARVLLSEIRQKNISKVDEEGTYCLLGGIIKPGGKTKIFWRSYIDGIPFLGSTNYFMEVSLGGSSTFHLTTKCHAGYTGGLEDC